MATFPGWRIRPVSLNSTFPDSPQPAILDGPNAKRIANIFDYTDSLTWIRGKHTLKFGGDIQRIQSTLTNSQDDPRGIFNFNGNYTSNQGAPGTGNPFASFPARDIRTPSHAILSTPCRRCACCLPAFFVQDDLSHHQIT